MAMDRRAFLLAGGAGVAAEVLGTARPASARRLAAQRWETLIGTDTFADYGSLESMWNYLYPWGSDHNGTARMYASTSDHNHVFIETPGALVLRASRISWDEGSSSEPPNLPIRYHSGALRAKENVLVNDRYPSWEVKGQFQAPSQRGAWPAFWLTGVNSWPPESDILEYKGDNNNWSNTYQNPDGGWSSTTTWVSDLGGWHEYRAWITRANDTDVDIHYYVDGNWVGQHRGADFVGEPMHIIINLQMEGSSGEPGPTGDTYYRARNIYIGRTNTG